MILLLLISSALPALEKAFAFDTLVMAAVSAERES